nr:PREDICTED: uncharacterized protein LOC107397639 [Tribolium castaneum]|eukprot:XP_015833968.1 PREDICTED: uncharacterized protein LOC107397639 [Tribolium castaneum]
MSFPLRLLSSIVEKSQFSLKTLKRTHVVHNKRQNNKRTKQVARIRSSRSTVPNSGSQFGDFSDFSCVWLVVAALFNRFLPLTLHFQSFSRLSHTQELDFTLCY